MIAHSSNPFQGSMTSNYQTLGTHLSREYQHTHMCVCVCVFGMLVIMRTTEAPARRPDLSAPSHAL